MGCQPYYFKRTGAARGDYRPGPLLAIAITKPERIALCQTKIRPGEEAHRAYPPSYSMREPRRGLPLHSIHLLYFDIVTLISRRDQIAGPPVLITTGLMICASSCRRKSCDNRGSKGRSAHVSGDRCKAIRGRKKEDHNYKDSRRGGTRPQRSPGHISKKVRSQRFTAKIITQEARKN